MPTRIEPDVVAATFVGMLVFWLLAWFLLVAPLLGWANRPMVEQAPSHRLNVQQVFERPAPPGAAPSKGSPW